VCIAKVRKPDLRQRLEAATPDVVSAADEYARATEAGEQHSPDPEAFRKAPGVDDEELVAVYTARMVPTKGAGRRVYDELILAAPNGRCPLCGHGIATGLDHDLAKSLYPARAVTPLNPVPACGKCDKLETDTRPESAQDVTLPPHFDDIESDPWLSARVEEAARAVAFSVNRSPG